MFFPESVISCRIDFNTGVTAVISLVNNASVRGKKRAKERKTRQFNRIRFRRARAKKCTTFSVCLCLQTVSFFFQSRSKSFFFFCAVEPPLLLLLLLPLDGGDAFPRRRRRQKDDAKDDSKPILLLLARDVFTSVYPRRERGPPRCTKPL